MGNSTAEQLRFVEDDEAEAKSCRPFVKWVGGKSQLIFELSSRIPKKINKYFEPFIGGGAFFFRRKPAQAQLSDINAELINAYLVVRDNVEALIKDLAKHVYEEDYFYNIRNLDRTEAFLKLSLVEKASRLIYLNKTCFNGLYRVNSKGQFNVPFGTYSNPTIVDAANLRACSRALKGVNIKTCSFLDIETEIETDDFIYFDPPYVPLNTTSYFTDYCVGGFGVDKQRELRDLCKRLDKRGTKFMLSNSGAEFVLELYKDFKISKVSATRSINSQASKRGKIEEVIVTNY